MRNIVLASVLAACLAANPASAAGSAAMQSFDHVPIKHYSGKTVPGAELEKAIVAAATRLGWMPTSRESGKLGFRLRLRSHTVDIEVVPQETEYAIRHVSSENMEWVPKGTELIRYGDRYTLDHDLIHPSYNKWINNLIRNINSELQRL